MPMKKHPYLFGFLFLVLICFLFALLLWVLNRTDVLDDLEIKGNRVAVIEIEGVIVNSKPTIDQIEKFRDDKRVKAVVLRIDSPGGGVAPSQEIFMEVARLREVKPVTVSLGSVAASGGYYIACASQRIVANPGSITGSIGVIIESVNFEDLMEKIGLKTTVIKSAKYKDILSPTRDMIEDERYLIQGVLDNIHNQFIEAVALGRNMPVEEVAGLADGRIFSGEQAHTLGLVDELGNLQTAIAAAAEMAGIEGKPQVVYPRRRGVSLLDLLIGEAMRSVVDFIIKNSFKVDYMFQNSAGDSSWQ